MNLLMITQLYPEPDDIGDNKPTRTVEYFAKQWIREGHKVVVIHCSSRFPILYYCIPKFLREKIAGNSSNIVPVIKSIRKLKREEFGIEIYRIPMLKVKPGQGYSEHKIQMITGEIIEILTKALFLPDVIMGHFANPSTALVSELSQYYQSKSSIVFHNDCTKKNISKYRLNNYISNINAIGARNLHEAKRIRELLKLQYDPFLCYSGVPNDIFKMRNLRCTKHSKNELKYLFVGSLIARKNVDVVIDAFDKTRNQSNMGSCLEIIGGGAEENSLVKLIANCTNYDRIKMVGRISRNEVFKHMKHANIFTLISDGEVYGMVYIEAMLQGCIVIASQGGGFDGIIKDGYNGFLCNPGDVNQLISIYCHIEGLSAERKNEIGQNAINTSVHFSEKEVSDNYLRDVLTKNERMERE